MHRFEYEKMRNEKKALHRQLIYEIACLFVQERKVRQKDIIAATYAWAEEHVPTYYHARGKANLNSEWVRRRLVEAISAQFLLLGNFEDVKLRDEICRLLPEARALSLALAPNAETLYRQACLDFEKKLIDKIASSRNPRIVVGVSGGRTMLAFSRTLHDMRASLKWHTQVPIEKKKKVVVCSLTCGGLRDNIVALSDTVAANIAEELGCDQSGFLAPPLFDGGPAKEAFKGTEEVAKHIELAHKPDIILTSVGNVHDENALTSQIIEKIDPEGLAELRLGEKPLGDILYYCYNGYTGDPIVLSKVYEKVLSVITCKELWDMVKNNETTCIVVAAGYEKGYNALRGVIARRMATDIHMDLDCARGLQELCQKGPD